jgi:hypothetical protein
MNQRNYNGQFTNRSRLLRLQMAENKRFIRQRKNNELLGACILGFLFALIVMSPGKKAKISSLEPVKTNNSVKVVKVIAEEPKRYCGDAISYIRCYGEDNGFTNDQIKTMIRIAKCESNYREDAMGVNKNKTVDRGIFQLNSIHKNISNKDAFTYETNIRYAYKMFKQQGTTPWNSSKHCWNK